MFLGEYEYAIDEKGRITLPVKFREYLRPGVVVTRGFERCLLVFPLPAWSELTQRLDSLDLTDAQVRRLRRLTFSLAYFTDVDRQGRILIPQNLRAYANLKDVGVVVGLNRYLEIWNPQRWQEERSTFEAQ
ncbi:MAG: cell division/cell wall cluster transcriptional repressor MraZ [Chloroflexota bacterium]